MVGASHTHVREKGGDIVKYIHPDMGASHAANDGMNNWNARLLQMAEEHPDAPGRAGEILRARLTQQAVDTLTHDLQLAHARAREAVVTGVSMSLRCGALLLQAPAGEFATLIRAADISSEAARHYAQLALKFPELRKRCERRNGRISEIEALYFLRDNPEARLPADPVTDLRALLQLNDQQT